MDFSSGTISLVWVLGNGRILTTNLKKAILILNPIPIMTARLLNITHKTKQDPTTFVGLHDFEYTNGEEVSETAVLNDSTYTLYCYDAASEKAIFTKTPANVDLTAAPFFYQAQYEHATHLLAIPKADFIQLGYSAPNPSKPVIMIHSVGRCGSTLLSQLFSALPNTVSLSEPDIFSNFVLMRDINGRNDTHLLSLLHAALKLQLKPLPTIAPTQWAIKFRSSGFEIADLISQALPDSQNLFLYRNLTDQTKSAIRAFNLQNSHPKKLSGTLLQRWLKLVPLLKKYKWQAKWRGLDRVDLSILAWLSRMDRYTQIQNQNIPIFAIKYEDMITQPEAIVQAIFREIGVPQAHSALTHHVFNRDSQAGSSLSRTKVKVGKPNQLSVKQQQQISNYLSKHALIKTPDYCLPNTLLHNNK